MNLVDLVKGQLGGSALTVKDLGAKLMPTIEAAMATPVVDDTLKPFVDDLRRKLNALGTA